MSSSKWSQVLKWLVGSGCLILFVFQLWEIVHQYQKKATNTAIEYAVEEQKELPAMTICNQIPYKDHVDTRSEVMGSCG